MKAIPWALLTVVVIGSGLPETAWAQYRSPRDYTKRIAPLTTPPASGTKPAPTPAPAQPAPPAAQYVTPPTDPAKAKADKEAALKRTVAFETKLAEGGTAWAQYELGLRYLKGNGVEKNAETGRSWLEKAARNGDEKAVQKLAELDATKPAAAASKPSPETSR